MIYNNKNSIRVLKQNYKVAVVAYIEVFEEKQDVKFEGWAGDEFGGVAYMGVVLINFNAIRYDIDVNAPKGAYIDYYEHQPINKNTSYANWLKMVHGIKKYYHFDDK